MKIYLCGPTVYDDVHIGNIFPVVIFDFLIRYLRAKNIDYIYLHNITDIDDKIIKKSQELGLSEHQLSTEYADKYLEILRLLNIVPPCLMPRVSEHMDEIKKTIERLLESGCAYQEGGNVLFRLSKVEQYGRLSNQRLEELKKVSDFHLWKKTKEGKVWESPWGEGRPGWHTECFAFIDRYFQGPADIHGGGVDLKFPHHENENAQCMALHGREIATTWIHVGHVSTEEGKISKSSNHKYLVKDLLANYSPNVIRWMCLVNHYSSPSVISDEQIDRINEEWREMQGSINRAISFVYLNQERLLTSTSSEGPDQELLSLLENDLALPQVLTLIQLWKKELLTSIKTKDIPSVEALHKKLVSNLAWMGFEVENMHTEKDLKMLDDWKRELDQKNWKNADEIREQLIKRRLI